VFVEVFFCFFGVCLVCDRFIDERARGIGGSIFAVCSGGQNRDVVEVAGTEVGKGR